MNAPKRYRWYAGAVAALAVAAIGLGLFFDTRTSVAQTAPAPAAGAAPAPVAPAAPGATLPPPDASTQPGGGIVATIDGQPITEQDLDAAYQEFADQLANFSVEQRRSVTIDLLIHIRLLSLAAQKDGIDKESAIASSLQLAHDRVLYNEYLNRLFDKEVTEDNAHALFDKEQATASTQFQYHVAHILVPTETEAKQVIAKLDAGGDFAQIAKDESIDTGSAPDGGDLGFIQAGDTVQEFETAAFALDIGKYTETPVESQFGFHVIKLLEKTAAPPQTFEDAIPDLQNELEQNAFQAAIDDLSKQHVVLKAPDLSQPATPGAPAAN